MNHEPPSEGPESNNSKANRYADHLLEKLSPANKPFAAQLAQKARNDGLKGKSVYMLVSALRHLDASMAGRPFASITAQDAADFISGLRATMADSSVFRIIFTLRPAMARALRLKELPEDLDEAL